MPKVDELRRELEDCLNQLVQANAEFVLVDHQAKEAMNHADRLKGQIENLNNHAKMLTTAISKAAYDDKWQSLYGPKQTT